MKWYKRYAEYCRKKGTNHVITDRDNNDPYLERFYLVPRWLMLGLGRVVIHRFWRSDNDGGLHDHPWPWASLILECGYMEHTPEGLWHRKPGDFCGYRKATDLHRVQLYNEGDEVWTMFFMGPRQRDWGFVDYETGEWTQWREYLDRRSREAHNKNTEVRKVHNR